MVGSQFLLFCSLATGLCQAGTVPVKRQDDDYLQCLNFCTEVTTDAADQSLDGTLRYCTNQTWTDQYNSCLNCVDEEDIPALESPLRLLLQACDLASSTFGVSMTSTTSSTSATSSMSITSTGAPNTAPTAVSGCHTHDEDLFCYVEGDDAEWEVVDGIDDDEVDNAPDSFSSCRPDGDDGDELICVGPDASEVELHRETDEEDDHDHSTSATTSPTPTSGGAGAATSDAAPEQTTGAASTLEATSMSVFALILAAFAL